MSNEQFEAIPGDGRAFFEQALATYLDSSSHSSKLCKHSKDLFENVYAPGVPSNYLTRIVANLNKHPAPKQLVFALMARKISFPEIGPPPIGLVFYDVALFTVLKPNGSFYLRYLRRQPIVKPHPLANEMTEFFCDDAIVNFSSGRNKVKIRLDRTRSKMTFSIDGKEFVVAEFASKEKLAAETFFERLRTILRPQNGTSFRALKPPPTNDSKETPKMKKMQIEWFGENRNEKLAKQTEQNNDFY